MFVALEEAECRCWRRRTCGPCRVRGPSLASSTPRVEMLSVMAHFRCERLPAMGGFEMIAREHSELNGQTPDAVKLSRRRSLACPRSLRSVVPTALPTGG
jgi:hypothetical protein